MNQKSLPVIIVSARDRTTAESFIAELIDNEVQTAEGAVAGEGRVWRLVNKYYRADVEVRARGDGDPEPDEPPEGHVVYFTPEECAAAEAGEAGVAERREARGAAVRVAALAAARAGAALAAWARRARYEPVALEERGERAADGPFAEEAGAGRVRAALHAHVWPGLRRLDRAAPPPAPCADDVSSGGEGDSEGESEEEGEVGEVGEEGEEDEAAAVRRAEQFALALGALGAHAGAGRAGGAGAGAGESDAERRERAEQLVAAFCRALGHDLDAC